MARGGVMGALASINGSAQPHPRWTFHFQAYV